MNALLLSAMTQTKAHCHILHASGASSPVAIVKVYSFALQDEGSDAILRLSLDAGCVTMAEGLTDLANRDLPKCLYHIVQSW
jgi:hypothetical protein